MGLKTYTLAERIKLYRQKMGVKVVNFVLLDEHRAPDCVNHFLDGVNIPRSNHDHLRVVK